MKWAGKTEKCCTMFINFVRVSIIRCQKNMWMSVSLKSTILFFFSCVGVVVFIVVRNWQAYSSLKQIRDSSKRRCKKRNEYGGYPSYKMNWQDGELWTKGSNEQHIYYKSYNPKTERKHLQGFFLLLFLFSTKFSTWLLDTQNR